MMKRLSDMIEAKLWVPKNVSELFQGNCDKPEGKNTSEQLG